MTNVPVMTWASLMPALPEMYLTAGICVLLLADALGSIEYQWPGNTLGSPGRVASDWRLRNIASESPPGKSVRQQPSMNSVSPATRPPSIRKHWLPGV